MPILELPQYNGIANPEHIESMGLVVLPLAVDVLAVADVDDTLVVQAPVLQPGGVEGEVDVD